jgi:hypothetical protein
LAEWSEQSESTDAFAQLKGEEKVFRAPSEKPYFKTGVLRRGSGTLYNQVDAVLCSITLAK